MLSSIPTETPEPTSRMAAIGRVLIQASPAKLKTKHGFASSMTYGAVAAPMVAIYPGTHAQVQVHGARPTICVYHMMTPEAPDPGSPWSRRKTRENSTAAIFALR